MALLAVAVVLGLITTVEGTRLLVRTAVDAAAAQGVGLRVEGLEGRLLGELKAERLALSTEGGVSVTATGLVLSANPVSLLFGTLQVQRVSAATLAIDAPQRQGPEEAGDRMVTISAPLRIRVASADLAQVSLTRSEPVLRIARASFAAQVDASGLTVTEAELSGVRAAGIAGHVTVSGRVGGRFPYPLELAVDWVLDRSPLGQPGAEGSVLAVPPRGEVRLRGDLVDLSVEQRFLPEPGLRLRGHLSVFDRARGLALASDLTLSWEGGRRLGPFRLPRPVGPGEIQLRGRPADYQLRLDSSVDLPRLGSTRLNGVINGAGPRWSVASVSARAPGAQASVAGGIDLSALSLDQLVIGLERLEGAVLSEGLEGSLRARVELDGGLRHVFGSHAAAPPLGIRLTKLQGRLGGATQAPLSGELAARAENGALTLSHLTLAWGDARLRGSATLGAQCQGQASLALPLERMAPFLVGAPVDPPDRQGATVGARAKLGGRLTADVDVVGPCRRPVIELAVTGQDLRQTALLPVSAGIEAVKLTAQLDTSNGSDAVTARLNVQGLAVGERRLARVGVRLDGRAGKHRLRIEAEGGPFSAALAADGAVDLAGRRWRGRVDALAIESAQAESAALHLDEPTPIELGPARIVIAPFCLIPQSAGSGGELCAELTHESARTRARGRLTVPELSAVLAGVVPTMVSPSLQWRGGLSGTWQFTTTPAAGLSGKLTLTAPDGALVAPGIAPEESLAYRDAALVVTGNGRTLSGELAADLVDRGELRASVTVTNLEDPQLAGDVRLRLQPGPVLQALLPVVGETTGRVEATLRARGAVRAPKVRARLALVDGTARITPLGIDLSAVELSARPAAEADGRPGRLAVKGRARSGEGTLEVDGWLEVEPLAARLEVLGDRVLAADTRDVRALISPRLRIELTPGVVSVAGDLRVPAAEIELRSLPARATRVTSDEVIVGEAAAEETDGLRTQANINVILGDSVRFEGFNLATRLAGRLRVTQGREGISEGAARAEVDAARAEGEIRLVDGVYEAYGRSLTVRSGRLGFVGPVANPGLSAEAVREVGGVTAGVRVLGTLRDPQLTLFSEPARDDTEILSLLVLGRPLEQAGGQDGERLAQAAALLGVGAGDFIAQRLGLRLGLDTMSVKRDAETGGGSLLLGKYLTPDLYVSVSAGLLGQGNLFNLAYALTPNLRIRAESGVFQNGVDLLYSIER